MRCKTNDPMLKILQACGVENGIVVQIVKFLSKSVFLVIYTLTHSLSLYIYIFTYISYVDIEESEPPLIAPISFKRFLCF